MRPARTAVATRPGSWLGRHLTASQSLILPRSSRTQKLSIPLPQGSSRKVAGRYGSQWWEIHAQCDPPKQRSRTVHASWLGPASSPRARSLIWSRSSWPQSVWPKLLAVGRKALAAKLLPGTPRSAEIHGQRNPLEQRFRQGSWLGHRLTGSRSSIWPRSSRPQSSRPQSSRPQSS